ncbi:COP23 domain-containing protein [Coleofasciculus sp. FACHB-SPT36]|uniref:COP23 domain-containing protein n=1 Tax=Cyanophyceae TaxID=3028117 RepID=UPI0018EF9BDF|nr:COP23 domain-containing protein [Coleofasciculus sp. FACHB-SPT36]
MSPYLSRFASETKSLVVKSVALSAGVAMLLNSGIAFAGSVQQAQLPGVEDENTQTSDGDVVVDTDGSPDSTTSSGTESENSTTANKPRFTCQLTNSQYMVMYHPKSQPAQAYAWATPSPLGGGWTAERRCNEISRRLESYRPDGLQEMRASVENNYNVVCITTQKNPDCRIVLTVPPGENPQLIRDRVFQNISTADSGQVTEGVNTFVGGRDAQMLNDLLNLGLSSLGGTTNRSSRKSQSVNLRPFLDRADGGTGTQLKGGVPMRSNRANPRLNPGNFR